MTTRASGFLATIRCIEEAHRMVEVLEDRLFGYQRREIIAAKLSIRLAERRLVSVANLRKPDSVRQADDA